MAKLIFAFCFCGILLAQPNPFNSYLFNISWESETCLSDKTPDFVLPTNLMCPDSEPNCYEPASNWDVGIAILNGPLKASKSYFKYAGKNELTAVMGTFNAMGDNVLLWLKGEASLKEGGIFLVRITREFLRASTGPALKRIGSYADFPIGPSKLIPQAENLANGAKALLKIPLLIEKNLDWGAESTDVNTWLISSLPGISFSLLEHYARYHRHFTLRPVVGLTVTLLEATSFYSMCSKAMESPKDIAEEAYKSTRQFFRILLHGLQYGYLLHDRNAPFPKKFQAFTYLTMFEHLLISVADLVYYNWYLQPTQ